MYQTNEVTPDTAIELLLPKKKGTSILDLHGVRDHVHNRSNACFRKQKGAIVFSLLWCYEPTVTIFGHSSKPRMRINISSTNYACMYLDSKHDIKSSKTMANAAVLEGKINDTHRVFRRSCAFLQ